MYAENKSILWIKKLDCCKIVVNECVEQSKSGKGRDVLCKRWF